MNDDAYYLKLPMREKNEHQVGQFFWVPSPMTSPATFSLRIGSWKAGIEIKEAKLVIKKVDKDELGKIKEGEKVDLNKMVIPEINLDSSEDLIVSKVKRRPAVLIYKECYNMRKFADVTGGIRGGIVKPNRHIFAPIYSLRKEENLEKSFPATFISKVQNNDYPNILFLPAYSTVLKNDSMLILSEMFSVNIKAITPTDFCLDPMLFGIQMDNFLKLIMDQADELQEKLDNASSS